MATKIITSRNNCRKSQRNIESVKNKKCRKLEVSKIGNAYNRECRKLRMSKIANSREC